MKKRFVLTPVIIVLVLALGSFLAFQAIKSQFANLPIKNMAEERLSALLGAKISVQTVRFGLLKPISLTGLKLEAPDKETADLNLASVKRISFQYNWMNFFNRDFINPNRVVLDSPRLLLHSLQIPARMFQNHSAGNGVAFLGRQFQLAIKGGTADYPLGGKFKISLRDINGLFLPQGRDAIKVSLDAKGAGIFRGHMVVTGRIHPNQRTYDLHLSFRRGGEILLPGFLKMKDVSGTLHLTPNKITFDRIRFRITDFLLEAKGEIRDWETDKPTMSYVFNLLAGAKPIQLQLGLDFKQERLSGRLDWIDEKYPFKGIIQQKDSAIELSQVELLGGYLLNGSFNFLENHFQLGLLKEPFRLTGDFSFDDWDMVATVKLEHWMIQETDVVTFLNIRLTPTPAFKSEKRFEFLGTLKTDYLILDTEPINDLDGTFQVRDLKLQNIDLRWGREFRLQGSYDFISSKGSELTLGLNRVDLANLKRLFFYERPKAFAGLANGKIELSGVFKNPLISGIIEVDSGEVGNFQYRSAYLKFSGYYPYLRLLDSQITKGKRRYYLQGDLNLRAMNIFQDLIVLSEDRIVVWRGSILGENLEKNWVRISDKLARKLLEPQ
jgi:hypothetical protein